jgi:hypothetical protein
MQGFKAAHNEATNMRIIDLLPKKVKRMIYRYQHQDKYKAALLMVKALRKDPDVISRGLTKKKIQGIAADHFNLNHREFAKILNRKTRYEDAPPGMADIVKKFKADGMDDDKAFALAWSIYNKKEEEQIYITEAYTIAYTKPADIKHIKFSQEELDDIADLYTKLKSKHATPLIFDSKNNRKPKVHTDLQGSIDISGRKLSYVFGKGSVGKGKAVDLEDFGIATATDFLEFFQAIGLQIGVPLDANNLKKTLEQLFIGGDFKIRDYIKDWKKFIAYIDADKSLGKDVIMLVNGSYYYRKEINVNKPYVIWDGIRNYYNALKKKEGIKGDVKPNTADIVLIDGSEKDLYDALKSKEPVITNDDGKLSCDGVDWYQISLKKADGQAKLGKITTLIKGKYQPDEDNMDLAKVRDQFPELAEQYLQEGFFGDTADKMKDYGKDAFKRFKQAAQAVLNFGKKVFRKMSQLAKKLESKTDKELQRLTKRSKYLNEMSQGAMLNAIVKDKRLRDSYTKTIQDYHKKIDTKSNEVVDIRVEKQNNLQITETTINFLVGNVISFQLINEIIKDVKRNGINVINDLNQSMAMGDTNLPVVKVYGNPSKADYDIITVGKITQAAPERDGGKIKVLKVAVLPYKQYYTVNMWLFAELVDGVAKYHKIAFKKSGASAFNYNIEGTSTVPEDKIREFQ